MRILFICNKSPFPAKEGGPIAMNAMVNGMINAGHQVKVLAVNSDKYSVSKSDIPEDYLEQTKIEFVSLKLKINPLHAFLNLFSKQSLHVKRFITPEFKAKLISILTQDRYDIVQFETLYVSPYIELIRQYSSAKIVLRAHNVEHLIWERLTAQTKNPLKKRYLHHITDTLRQFELSNMNLFDGIAAITDVDAQLFKRLGCKVPIEAFPFGVDTSKFRSKGKVEQKALSLFHLGSMDWMPNIEAVDWFLDEIWPSVIERFPEAHFYLAGRNMPSRLKDADIPGLMVVGEVDDAYEFMLKNGIMVVPLRSGSGIRIKIIEGMALSVPIISTSIGAEGIAVTSGKDILLADDKEAFIATVCQYLPANQKIYTIGESGQKTIFAHHDNDKIIYNLQQFYLAL